MKKCDMKKQVNKLLGYVKEEDFETLIWCVRQYAAEGMNEKWQAEQKTA